MTSNANRGRDWELVLDGWHDRYRLEGRAFLHRTPPPVRVLSRVAGGVFRGTFLGLGPPDYAGVVAGIPGGAADGRPIAVAFDAKDCAETRWPLSKLEEHQARDLEEWSRMGGFAFVALRLRGTGWVLPWNWLAPRWCAWSSKTRRAEPGTASIGVEDFESDVARMPRLGDWLACLS